MIEIVPADREMLRYVLRNLRDLDRVELEACGSDLAQMPNEIMRRKVFAFCAGGPWGGPISAWGMLEVRPGVGAGFAFGTNEWGHALLAMVHHIRRFALPHLQEAGYHRVAACALAHRLDVCRFMMLIGAEPEGLLRGFGRNGEDFVSYRWLSDELRGERHTTSSLQHTHTAH